MPHRMGKQMGEWGDPIEKDEDYNKSSSSDLTGLRHTSGKDDESLTGVRKRR